MLNEDIAYAQKLISGNKCMKFDKTFHDKSFIYRTTNENISLYQGMLKNKNKVLSVTASGDHILNSILFDSYNIDGFDISVYPYYYFNLKLAAILSLNKKEYLDFFFTSNDQDYLYDLYTKIRDNLDVKSKKFWDSLYYFFDIDEVYNSYLFSHELINMDRIIEYNPYLQDDNYLLLHKKISDLKFRFYKTDIKSFNTSEKYNLILLSNIIEYEKNLSFLKNLPLTKEGTAISYSFNKTGHILIHKRY